MVAHRYTLFNKQNNTVICFVVEGMECRMYKMPYPRPCSLHTREKATYNIAYFSNEVIFFSTRVMLLL